ncbi:MAG: hypothetical protein HFF66_06655 [Oscillospiraceae bacterium]|nr:hypothetical protein [Oscillospiraceae bacterium]
MQQIPICRPDERAGLVLRELYHRHGYQPYRMSKFEPYDLYVRNKSFLVSENILTFTDTDGRLMALKPDVTLSIVKNAQAPAGALEKVYYSENVYRTSPASVGYREIMQTGLECIGALDAAAVGEVLILAAESLAALGGGAYLLDLGHMELVAGLLEELAEGHRARAALAELAELCGVLECRGLLENLRLDFSIANNMSYYNGIIFRGYLPGLASGVLAGGRYDNLMRRMGKTGGAVGFAVYLDQLERLDGDSGCDVDVLLLYGPGDSPAAVARRAGALMSQGKSVRTERGVPAGLRCREIVRFGEGGEV